MNKIYKVIWSKTKHCYIVASELAKSHTKGSGARSLRRAAVCLGVAAALIGGVGFGSPVAWAADISGGSSITISDTSRENEKIYLNGSNIAFTVSTGGAVYNIIGNNTGSVSGNTIVINGGTITNADVEYDSSWNAVPSGINGGYSTTGAVSDNHITITNATIGGYYPSVHGGHSDSGNVSKNTVTIDSNNGIYIYGGHSDTGAVGGDTAADGNIVTVKSGAVHYVAGGWSGKNSDGGMVKNNQVTVENGTVGSQIFGGASDGGNVELNRVLFEKGSAGDIFGGQSGGKDVLNNTVTINDGTVTNVYGGQAVVHWMTGDCGDAKGNQVTIGGGTISGVVYGGYSESGAANTNIVTINGGTVNQHVYGGISSSGDAKSNQVWIYGIGGSGDSDGISIIKQNVYGGYTGTGSATNNVVSLLSGKTTIQGSVYGGGSSQSSNTNIVEGNKLQIEGYGHRVDGSVKNFENIILVNASSTGPFHDGETILSAGKFEANADNTRTALNIKSIEGGLADATSGQMTLLASDTADDFRTLSLTYSGGTENLSETNQSKVLKSGDETPEATPVNGVTLTYASSHMVSLDADNSYRNVLYKVESIPSKISLGDMTWGTGRNLAGAFTFGSGAVVDATNLAFGDITTALSVNDSLTLVENATGITSAITPTAGNNKTVKIKDYTDATGIGYEATASGNVTADTDAVKYTVSSVTADKIVLTGKEWGAAADDLPDTWKASASTEVDATGFSYTGTADTALKIGDTAAILNAPGLTTASSVTGGTDKTLGIDYTDSAGIKFDATATGHVAAAANAVNYVVGSVAVNAVDLVNWDGTTSAVTDGWTKGTTVAVDTGSTVLDLAAVTDVLTSDADGLFAGAVFSGVNDYTDTTNNQHAFASDTDKGVTLDGYQVKGIKASDDGKNLVYAVDDTKNVTAITLGQVKEARDMSGTAFDFAATEKVDASGLELDITPSLDMTSAVVPLVTSATNLKSGVTVDYGTGKTNHTQDFFLTHEATGIGVDATVTGIVATAAGSVNYVALSAVMNSVDLADWNGNAVTEDMSKVTGKEGGVAVTTGNFAEPGTVGKGQSIDIITTNTENFFGEVTGEKKFTEAAFTDDTVNGVTLSGNKFGGVKATNDNKVLTYYGETMGVENVAFGTMAWGTGRAAAEGYDFAKVTSVDASGLEFAKPEEVTGSMDLLSNATNLAADTEVTGATHTQNFDKTLDNQTVISATLTGTVSVAADTVSYSSSGTGMSRFDLAGWDGATADAVPAGWTLATGATVETDGMTTPEVEAGKQVAIITSGTDGFFENAVVNGGNKYQSYEFNEKDSGITFAGSQEKGVKADGTSLVYAVGTKDVSDATVTGEIAWSDGGTYYKNTEYTFSDNSKIDISGVNFNATEDPLAGGTKTMTLISNAAGAVTAGSPTFNVAMSNTKLKATAEGEGAVEAGKLAFKVTGVTLDKVTVSSTGSDAVPEGWQVAGDLTVDTDSMTVPTDVAAGEEKVILTASGANTFSEDAVTGVNAYKEENFSEASDASVSGKGVTVAGKQGKGVTASDAGRSLVYKVGKKEADSITLDAVDWEKGATVFDGSSAAYDYTKVSRISADGFDVTYANPETVASGDSMTLLKANDTLKDMAAQSKTSAYSYTPVSGVTVDANLTGSLAAKSGTVTFTAAENKASTLTFGDVEWKDSGALIEHKTTLANVSFDGAAVDTAKINFTNKQSLDANQKMTLVSDFGGMPGSITGDKYKVGTAYEGEGSASMDGDNLIFTTKTGAGKVSDETHNTVMAMEAGMAMLAAGNEYVGKVMDGLANIDNFGEDGVATAAAIGGGTSRYETGSRVNTRTWNAAVGVGTKRDVKNGVLEYGLFGEYGKGNYSLHSSDGRGDGDAHYAGGGLLAKWKNNHDVYTEASFRLGRMSDSASDILHDGAGNGYGYNVHANYYGAHVGVGKVFAYDGGRNLDVYGKFFYTKKDGVNFTAGIDRYDLDRVASSVLRVGARYGTTDKLWNWYGGLAYEYEFDGEAEGKVNGTAIRAASVKGSSVRGEFGMRMSATRDNPWQADISLYGYGGKHRGLGGNVSVAYMF